MSHGVYAVHRVPPPLAAHCVCLLYLHQASPWDEYPSWAGDGMMDLPTKGKFYGPLVVVDGHVLPDAPPEGGAAYNDVPIVVGTTEQEADFR